MNAKKGILLAGFIIAIAIAAFKCYEHTCIDYSIFSPQNIKDYILGFGPWALLVYTALYAANTVSVVPPIGAMSLAAGFIFGPLFGTIGIMTGSFIGTSVTFFISRLLGRRFVDRLARGRFREFEQKLNENGFVAILFIRLVPLIPWEVVNYAAGLSKIKYRDYILATLIGIFPSVIIQTFFSDSISNFDIGDPKLLIATGGFILLIFVPTIYLAIKKKKEAKQKA